MALKGELSELDVPGLLQLIATHGKTGTLVVRDREEREVSVLFDEGDIVGAVAAHRQQKERLGELLVKAELLVEEQLEAALEEQSRTGSRLGEVLVKNRVIRRNDLADMLRVQVYETVFRMFTWKDGTFEFLSGDVDYDRGLMQPIRTDHILMDSFRMIDEWPLIKRWVPSFDRIIEKTEAGQQVRRPLRAGGRGDVDLSDSEWVMLDLADDRPSVQRAIHRSRLGEFEACKALKELQERGILRLVQPGDETPREAARPRPKRRRGGVFLARVANAVVALGLVAALAGLVMRDAGGASDSAFTRVVREAARQRASAAAELYRVEQGRVAENLQVLAQAGLIRRGDLELLKQSHTVDAEGRVVEIPLAAPPEGSPDVR